jgi:thiamine-monophosphate kinase
MDKGDPRRTATTADLLVRALHRPEPRLGAGAAVLAAGVHCAMDLSDGLAGDLRKLMAASRVDAEIELDRLPIPAAVRSLFRDEATQLAVTGGDDYELLFTAPEMLAKTVETALRAVGTAGSTIGRLVDQAGRIPVLTGTRAGEPATVIEAIGFDHFERN